MDLLKSIINIPGDVLQKVTGLLPNSADSNFEEYCKNRGGKMVKDADGNRSCQMGFDISEGHHGQMVSGESSAMGSGGFSSLPGASPTDFGS